MIAPAIAARIEQRNFRFGLWVNRDRLIGFSAIAMETRECQIIKLVSSTLNDGEKMIDRELDVLPLFGSVTILAEKVGSFPDLLLKIGGKFATGGHFRRSDH